MKTEAQKRANFRYKQSIKGKAAAIQWRHSAKGKEVQARYLATEKGKATRYRAYRLRIARFPEKKAANDAVHYALRIGTLIRQPCVICADPESEAHHPDYSKPLEIEWLCKCHHIEKHLEEKRHGA